MLQGLEGRRYKLLMWVVNMICSDFLFFFASMQSPKVNRLQKMTLRLKMYELRKWNFGNNKRYIYVYLSNWPFLESW